MVDRSSKVRLFIREELSQNIDIALSEDQAKYLFKVMRLNIGQVISVFDGKTGEYEAKICEKSVRAGKIRVLRKKNNVAITPNLWLLFSPLRKNRTEWLIEKATELGVRRIIPVITSRTIVRSFRMARLNSIMIEALEQCGGTFLPNLTDPVSLDHCLDTWNPDRHLIFCDESLSSESTTNTLSDMKKRKKETAILIGPEGGFSESEGQLIKQLKNVSSVSLGSRILRADTAAVAAISIWQSVNLNF